MIKYLLVPAVVIIVISSCFRDVFQKKIHLNIDGERDGWYFVVMKYDTLKDAFSNEDEVFSCDDRFVFMSMPSNLKESKFVIQDCASGDDISDKMKLIGFSKGKGGLRKLSFYNPHKSLVNANFIPSNEEPSLYDKLSREETLEWRSLILENNINWLNKLDDFP